MADTYKFSIVIAAYNTAEYLSEAIDSSLNQSIGLESIQVIVVNDGSSDLTQDVIDEYVKRYPGNVK